MGEADRGKGLTRGNDPEENMRKATERGVKRMRRAGTRATVVVMFAVLFVSVLFGTLGINFADKYTEPEVAAAWYNTVNNMGSTQNATAGDTYYNRHIYQLLYHDNNNSSVNVSSSPLPMVKDSYSSTTKRVTVNSTKDAIHEIQEPGVGTGNGVAWEHRYFWMGSSVVSNGRCIIYYIPYTLSDDLWDAIQNGVKVHCEFKFNYKTWAKPDRCVPIISSSIDGLIEVKHTGGGEWGTGSGAAGDALVNQSAIIAWGTRSGGSLPSDNWMGDLSVSTTLTKSNVYATSDSGMHGGWEARTIYLAAYMLPWEKWDWRLSGFEISFWYVQSGTDDAVTVHYQPNNAQDGSSQGGLATDTSAVLSDGTVNTTKLTTVGGHDYTFKQSLDTHTVAALPSAGYHFVNWTATNPTTIPAGTANNAVTTNPRSWDGTNVIPGQTWTANFAINKMQIILHSNYGTDAQKVYWKDYNGDLYTLENGVKTSLQDNHLPDITSLWNREGSPYVFGGWFATQACSGAQAYANKAAMPDRDSANGVNFDLTKSYARGYADTVLHLYAKWAGPDFGTIASALATNQTEETVIDTQLRTGDYRLNGVDLGLWGGVTNPFVIDSLDSFNNLAKIVNGGTPQDSVTGNYGQGPAKHTAAADKSGSEQGYIYDGCFFVISTDIDLNNERLDAIGKNDDYPFGGNLSGNYAFFIYLAEHATDYLAGDRHSSKVMLAQAREEFEKVQDSYTERGFNTTATIKNLHIVIGRDTNGTLLDNNLNTFKYTGLIGCYDSYIKTGQALSASSITQARYITDIVVLSGYVANRKKDATNNSYDAVGGLIGCFRKGNLNIINCTVGDKNDKSALQVTTSQENFDWGRHVGGMIGMIGKYASSASVTQGELHAILNMESCESYATVTCIGKGNWDTSAGGLIGSTYAKTDSGTPLFVPSYQITIKGCKSDAIISGFRDVGGIAGLLTTHSANGGKITIQNCVSTAELQINDASEISRFYKFGGIVGEVTPFQEDNYTSVSNRNFYNVYNPGPIMIEYVYSSSWISNYTNQSIQYVGGIVGAANFDRTNLKIDHAYYDGNMGDGGGGSSLIDKYGNSSPVNALQLTNSWAFLSRALGQGPLSATVMTAPPNTNTLIGRNYGKYIFYTSTYNPSTEATSQALPAVRMLPMLKPSDNGEPTYFDSWDGILTNDADGFYAYAEDMPYGYYMFSGKFTESDGTKYVTPYSTDTTASNNDVETDTNKVYVKYGYDADNTDTYSHNAMSVGLDLIVFDSQSYPNGEVNKYFVYDGENHLEGSITMPPLNNVTSGMFYLSKFLDNNNAEVESVVESGVYNINASVLADNSYYDAGRLSGSGIVGRLKINIHIERRTLIVDDIIMTDGSRWKAEYLQIGIAMIGDGTIETNDPTGTGAFVRWTEYKLKDGHDPANLMVDGGNDGWAFNTDYLATTNWDVKEAHYDPTPFSGVPFKESIIGRFVYNLDWQGLLAIGLRPNWATNKADLEKNDARTERLYMLPLHWVKNGDEGYQFKLADASGNDTTASDAFAGWLAPGAEDTLNNKALEAEFDMLHTDNHEKDSDLFDDENFQYQSTLTFRYKTSDDFTSPWLNDMSKQYNYGVMLAGQKALCNTNTVEENADEITAHQDDEDFNVMNYTDGTVSFYMNIDPINIEEDNKRFVLAYGAAEGDTPNGVVSTDENDTLTLDVVSGIHDTTAGKPTAVHTLKYTLQGEQYLSTNGIALIYMDHMTVGKGEDGKNDIADDAIFDKWSNYTLFFSTMKEKDVQEGGLYNGKYIDVIAASAGSGKTQADIGFAYYDPATGEELLSQKDSGGTTTNVIKTLNKLAQDGHQTVAVRIYATGMGNFSGVVERYVVYMSGDFGKYAEYDTEGNGTRLPDGGEVRASEQWGTYHNPYVLSHEAHLIRLSRIVNGAQPWDSVNAVAGSSDVALFKNDSFATDRSYKGDGGTPAIFVLTKDMSLTSGATETGTAGGTSVTEALEAADPTDEEPTGDTITAYGGFMPIGQYNETDEAGGHPFSGAIFGGYELRANPTEPSGAYEGYRVRYTLSVAGDKDMNTGLGLFGYTNGAYIRGITVYGSIAMAATDDTTVEGAETTEDPVPSVEYKHNYVGGLIGYAKNTTVSLALSRVDINMPKSDYVGGLIGYGDEVFYNIPSDNNISDWMNPGSLESEQHPKRRDNLYVYSDTLDEISSVQGRNYVGGIAGYWKIAEREKVGLLIFEHEEWGYDATDMFPVGYNSMGDPMIEYVLSEETNKSINLSMLSLLSAGSYNAISNDENGRPDDLYNVNGVNYVGGLVGEMDTSVLLGISGMAMEIYPYITSTATEPFRVAGYGYTGGLYGKFVGSGYKSTGTAAADSDTKLIFSTQFDGTSREINIEVQMFGEVTGGADTAADGDVLTSVMGGLVGYAQSVGLLFDTPGSEWVYNNYITFSGFDAAYVNDFVGGIVGVLADNATIEGVTQTNTNGQDIGSKTAKIVRTRGESTTEGNLKESVNGSFVGSIAGFVAASAGAQSDGGTTKVGENVSFINRSIQTGNHFVGGIFGAIGLLQMDIDDFDSAYGADIEDLNNEQNNELKNLLFSGTASGSQVATTLVIDPNGSEGNGDVKFINQAGVHGKVGGSATSEAGAAADASVKYGDYVGGLIGYVGGNTKLVLVNKQLDAGLSNNLANDLNVFNGNADLTYSIKDTDESKESKIEESGVIIEGRNYVGGIAGYIAGTDHQITRFVNRARIVGRGTVPTTGDNIDHDGYYGMLVGGVAGYMEGGTISDSMAVPQILANEITSNTDFIRGERYTGGIVGGFNAGTISNCIVTGISYRTMTADCGGIVGAVGGGTVADSWTLFTVGETTTESDGSKVGEAYPTSQSICANNYGKYIIIDSRVAQMPNLYSISHMIGLVKLGEHASDGGHTHTGINDAYNPGETGYLSFAATVPTAADNLVNTQLVFYNATGFNNAATHNFTCLAGNGTNVYFKLPMSEKSLLVCVADVTFKGYPSSAGDTPENQQANRDAIMAAYKSPVRENNYYDLDKNSITAGYDEITKALKTLEASPVYLKGVLNGADFAPFVVGNVHITDTKAGESEANPLLISNQEDWNNFAQMVREQSRDGTEWAFQDQYVKLATDDVVVTVANLAGNTKDSSSKVDAHNYKARFAGHFDGDGHTITLEINGGNDDAYLGLFQGAGGIDDSHPATFDNLTLTGYIKSNCSSGNIATGAFIGAANGPVTFTNCVNKATVDGWRYVGGFIGQESDGAHLYTFIDCVNEGNILNRTIAHASGASTAETTAVSNAVATGGFIARNWGGTSYFYSCLNKGNVMGSENVGGLYGLKHISGSDTRDTVLVYNSGNRGNVTAYSTQANLGGMGVNTIEELKKATGESSLHNQSDVNGYFSYAAGLVAAVNKVRIVASFNEGTVTGYGSVVGGLYAGAVGDGTGLKTEAQNNNYKYVNTLNRDLRIVYSYNAGTVQAGGYGNDGTGWDVTNAHDQYNGTIVGGLAGFITGVGSSSANPTTVAIVKNCYNVGDVISWGTLSLTTNSENHDQYHRRDAVAGGLVGAIYFDSNMSGYSGTQSPKLGTTISNNYNWGNVKLMATLNGNDSSGTPFVDMGGQIVGYLGNGNSSNTASALVNTNNLQKKNGVFVAAGEITSRSNKSSAVRSAARWTDRNADDPAPDAQWTGKAVGGTTVNAEEITTNFKYWFKMTPTNTTLVESLATLNGQNGAQTNQQYINGDLDGWIYIRGCLPQLAVFALRSRDGLSMLAQDTARDEDGDWVTAQAGKNDLTPYSITGPVDMQAMSQLINLGFEFGGKFISIDNDIDMNYMQYSDTLPVAADLQPAENPQGDGDFLVGGYSFKQGGYNYYVFGKGALRSMQRTATTAGAYPADNRATQWQTVEQYIQVNADGGTVRTTPWTSGGANKSTAYQYLAGQQQPQTIDKFATYYPNNMMHHYATLQSSGAASGMAATSYGSFKGSITGAIKDANGVVTGNHTISNMRVAWGGQVMPEITPYVFQANVGLFGSTSDATISYITLDDTCRFTLGTEINSTNGGNGVASGYIGGFVANALGDLTLIGVEMNADLAGGTRASLGTTTVNVEANAGGLVGVYDGNTTGKALTIVNSKVGGHIYGKENAGGFVGVVNGDVKGSLDIGSAEDENIFSGNVGTYGTYNTAVNYRPFGGIIGRINSGSIYGYFTNLGSVNGGAASTDVGGVIGYAGANSKIGVLHTVSEFVNGKRPVQEAGGEAMTADDPDSTQLYGAGYIGGVIGRMEGAAEGDTYSGVENSHKTAIINYSTSITPNRENTPEYAVGGLIGYMGGGKTVGGLELHNYADLTISGSQAVNNVGGAIGYISFANGGAFSEDSPVFFDVRGSATNGTPGKVENNTEGKNVGGVVGNLKSATKLAKVIIMGVNVVGYDNVGGIVGCAESGSSILQSVNVGGTVQAKGDQFKQGGIVGSGTVDASTSFWYVSMDNEKLSAMMTLEANIDNIAADEWGGIYADGNGHIYNTGAKNGSNGRYFFYSSEGGRTSESYTGVTVGYGYDSDSARAKSLEYWLNAVGFGSITASDTSLTYGDQFNPNSLYAYAYPGREATEGVNATYLRIVYAGTAAEDKSTQHERTDKAVATSVIRDGRTYFSFNFQADGGAHNIAVYYHTMSAVVANDADYDGEPHRPEFEMENTGLTNEMQDNSEWTKLDSSRAGQYWYDIVLTDEGGADIPRERRFIDAGTYSGSLTVFLYDDEGYPKNVGSVPFEFRIVPIRVLLTHNQKQIADGDPIDPLATSSGTSPYTGGSNSTNIFIYILKKDKDEKGNEIGADKYYSTGVYGNGTGTGFLDNVRTDKVDTSKTLTEMEVWFDYVTDDQSNAKTYSLHLPKDQLAPGTSKGNKKQFTDYSGEKEQLIDNPNFNHIGYLPNSDSFNMVGMKEKGFYQIRFEVKDVANGGNYIEPKIFEYDDPTDHKKTQYIQIGNYIVLNELGGENAPNHVIGKVTESSKAGQPLNAFTFFQVIKNDFILSWEPTKNTKIYDGNPFAIKARFTATSNFVYVEENDNGDITSSSSDIEAVKGFFETELNELIKNKAFQWHLSGATGVVNDLEPTGTITVGSTGSVGSNDYQQYAELSFEIGPDAGTYEVGLKDDITSTTNCEIKNADGSNPPLKYGVFTIEKRDITLGFTSGGTDYDGEWHSAGINVTDGDGNMAFSCTNNFTKTSGVHRVTLNLIGDDTVTLTVQYNNGTTTYNAACNAGKYSLVVLANNMSGDVGNYNISAATRNEDSNTYQIRRADISITFAQREFTYNASEQGPTASLSVEGAATTPQGNNTFRFGNETITLVTTSSSVLRATGVGSYSIVVNNITVSGSNAAGETNRNNYKETINETFNYVINPYIIQGTPDFSKVTKIYDGTPAYNGSVTITFNDSNFARGPINLVEGSDFTVTSANFEDKNVGTGKTVKYVLRLTGQTANNFDLSASSDEGEYEGEGEITPLALVVSLDRLLNGAAVKTYDGTDTYGGTGAQIKGNSQRSAIYRSGEGFTVTIANGQNVTLSETDAVTMTAVYKEDDERYSAFVNGIRPNTDAVAAKSLVFTLKGSNNYTFTVNAGDTTANGNSVTVKGNTNLTIQIKQKSVRVTYENTRQSYVNPDNIYNTDWKEIRANLTSTNGFVLKDRGNLEVAVSNGWMNDEHKQYEVIFGKAGNTELGAVIKLTDAAKDLAPDPSVNYKLANQPTLVIGYFIEKGNVYEIGSVASLIMATYYYTVAANMEKLPADMLEHLFGKTNVEVKIEPTEPTGSNFADLITDEALKNEYSEFIGKDEGMDNFDNFIDFLNSKDMLVTELEGDTETYYFYQEQNLAAADIKVYNQFKLVADFDGIFTELDIQILDSVFTDNDGPAWGVGKTYVNNFFVGKVGSALTAINGVFSSGTTFGVAGANENGAFMGVFDGNGYVINTVKIIATGGNVGFFSEIGAAGVIKNLHLRNVDIAGTGKYIGGIAGSVAAGSGTDETTSISNVSVQGVLNINNATSAGMLFGNSARNISNAIAIGTINTNGVANVGGAIGETSASASSVASMTYVWAKSATSVGGIVGSGSATDNTYLTNSVYKDGVAVADGTSVSYDDLREGSTTGYDTEKYYLSTATKGKYDVLTDTTLDNYPVEEGQVPKPRQSLRFVDIVDTYLLKYAITANETYSDGTNTFTVYTQATVSYLVGESKGTTDSRIKIGNVNGIALLSELRFAAFELTCDVKAPYTFRQYAGAFFGDVEMNEHHIVFADWDGTTALFEYGAPEGILAKA